VYVGCSESGLEYSDQGVAIVIDMGPDRDVELIIAFPDLLEFIKGLEDPDLGLIFLSHRTHAVESLRQTQDAGIVCREDMCSRTMGFASVGAWFEACFIGA